MTENAFLVTSRSFEEYLAFFGLDPYALPRRILDVSAGASSFVAEASRRGVVALAVDPVYRDPDLLRGRALASRAAAHHTVTTDRAQFTFDWYGTPAAREAMRTQAMETFLTDHRERPERYVGAELPALPLANGSFELALCSHLLFTWADVLDEGWHLAALVELARVAREVRVFPLVMQGTDWLVPFLEPLRQRLAQEFGITSKVMDVPYEFQRGAHQMLVLRRVSPLGLNPPSLDPPCPDPH